MQLNNEKKIKIMGILNLTPDSFSDGGKFNEIDKALYHVSNMIDEGADIIDVGGESSRPGSDGISTEEEIDRVIPIIKKIKSEFDIIVSIDTVKSVVAEIAVSECHVDIINDISALSNDKKMVSIVSKFNIPIVLMHRKGISKTMQEKPFYNDVIGEISQFFEERIIFALDNGIKKKNIILDPGIGFGKRLEDNINIIKNLAKFEKYNLPILMGLSRKRFLGEITNEENPEKREIETAIANLISIKNGASILRVHNIKATKKMLDVFYTLN